MKRNLFLILFTLIVSFVNAQAFRGLGDQKVQLGINSFGYGAGISATYDYGALDWLSLGGGADIYWSKDDDFFIYGRANFHLGDMLNLPDNMDLYPGLNVGGRNDGFGIGVHLGYRYFLNNKIGAFIEIGSHGVLGVSINL